MRIGLLSLLAFLLVVSSAQAASGVVDVPRLPGAPDRDSLGKLSGPAVAADGVLLARGSDRRGFAVARLTPGRPVELVAAIGPERETTALSLSGSATRNVVSRHVTSCGSACRAGATVVRSEVLAGPRGGALARVVGCGPGLAPCVCGGGQRAFSMDLDGDLLLVADGCAPIPTVQVIDLASGVARTVGQGFGWAIGNGRVAVAEYASGTAPRPVVVRDARTGDELYRAALPSGSLEGLVLLDHGEVVSLARVNGAWAVVGLPSGRVIGTWGGTVGQLLGGGGSRVAVRTNAGLAVFDAAGGPTVEVPLDRRQEVGADFDGRSLAWSQQGCTTVSVSLWTLHEPRPAAPDLACGTPTGVRRTAKMTRRGRLAVPLRCPAARGGCLSRVRLVADRGRTPRGRNGAARRYVLGRTDVALNPSETAAVTISVPAGARQWLRRQPRSRLRLRIEATTEGASRGTSLRSVPLRLAR